MPQADGKLLFIGQYNAGSDPQNVTVGRFNADGTFDAGFAGGITSESSIVNSVAVQADGKVVIGGEFTTVNGVARATVARLHNDAATQNLCAPDATRVVWERGGAAQDLSSVTFELSTDGGGNWSLIGAGTRVGTTGDWQLAGLTLPAGGRLRARGRAAGGYGNGSSGLAETIADFPAAPAVITRAASALSTTGATLGGTVSSNGLASDATFQYSTDPGLTAGATTTTATQMLPSDAVGNAVNQAITGLAPHTAYYFRARAVNSPGTTLGAIVSFTTANTAPSAPDGPATVTTGDQKTITLPFASTDADGDTVTLSSTTPGAHLTVNSTSGKDVTFTAAANFAGSASLGYSVSDGFGGTANGTITVTISDNDAPTISAPTDGLTAYAGTLPDYTGTSPASDNVGVTSVTQSPAPGTTTIVGEVDVTVTAKDAAANESSATFTVATRPLDAVPMPLLAAGGTPPGAGTPDGPPADAEVTTFGVPAIDAAGNVAYLVQWGSDTDGKGKGLFTDLCLAKVGDDVPGIAGATFKSFSDPVIDGGRVACLATFAGVPKSSAAAVLSFAPDGTLTVVARAGDPATADGATFKSFTAVAVADGYTAVFAKPAKGSGAPKVTAASEVGLWVKDGSGPLELVLREGQIIGGATIKTLVSFKPGDGSPGQGRGWLRSTAIGGQVLALAIFSDKSQGIVFVDADDAANPQLLSLSKQTADGSPDIAGATFASYSLPALARNDASAFLASLTVGAGGATKANARGIFHKPALTGNYAAIARVGDPAGATGATFSVMKDPVLAADGGLAFAATVKGGGLKGTATATLWWQSAGGSLALLAQGGAEPPDVAGGEWKAFTSPAIAGGRGPIFSATLVPGKGGVIKSSASGVWACNFAGSPRLLFRTGDTDIIAGKTLKSFTLLNATVGSTGVTRSFNDAAQVAWLATFTDKSQAIITTVVP
ncbi:MAG: choice-of-anchor tandem repeat NxxGxxAF-containing protein [Chthoniobacteraceae bacterium]